MKVLLYDTGDVRGELNEPIGIELLAAHLFKELEEHIRLDLKWYNFDGYVFDPIQYDVIGISIHINGLDVFEAIYNILTNKGYKGLVVTGNSIPTFAYEYLLGKYPEIVCVVGEGEDAFCKIVLGCSKGHLNLSCIPNLAYNDNGNIVTTERAVCNMNEYLPPIRTFNDQLLQNKGIARIEASRGCSWNKCHFCGTPHKYNDVGWRPIDIEIIIRQLIQLSKMGHKTIYFCDEDFIGNDRQRFATLVDCIRQKMDSQEISHDASFFISVKPPDLISNSNVETINRFAKCGLKELFVGLESGCNSQLKRYNKCTNVKINALVAKRLRELEKSNLTIDIGFIFFDSNMTPGDIEENINFIETNKLYMLASSLIKPIRIQPFTKTFVYSNEFHKNAFSPDDLMYDYTFENPTVERIYTVYSDLNLEAIAHKLQSVYRRELSLETQRALVGKKLIELRFLQFTSIKIISSYYIRGSIESIELKSKLEEILTRATNLLPDA